MLCSGASPPPLWSKYTRIKPCVPVNLSDVTLVNKRLGTETYITENARSVTPRVVDHIECGASYDLTPIYVTIQLLLWCIEVQLSVHCGTLI